MNHNYIGTEHILLALLRRPDGLLTRSTGRFRHPGRVRDDA